LALMTQLRARGSWVWFKEIMALLLLLLLL